MSFKRLLSFLLAIVMIFSMLPAGVMAVDSEDPEVSGPESSVDPTGGTDETHPTEPSVGQYDYPLLELDVRATAEITEPGGMAYFRFTAASSCHLQFTSYAEQDTYGHLYDSEMREVSTDDNNGEMNNFAISYKVEAGETYILGVRYWDGGYVGSYEISVSHDPMWLNCRTEQQATCTQTGIEVRYCTTCDYESEPIYTPAGCQYEQTEYVSATCTTGGYAVFTCALCGNSRREEYPSNGHSYHMETVKHSSCTEEGLLRQTCVSCGYYVESTIPAMGHNYDHGTCTHCGDVINASGTCGDNITWTFSGTDCTLYLTGSGPMAEMSTDWRTYQHHIEKIVVGEGITSLASCAFTDCYYVTEVILPSTLTRIENNAFQHCSALKRITLPGSLEYLGEHAFYNSGLETITLPAGFTSMEVVSAFDGCYNLQEILVEQGNPTFTSVDGVLYCQNGAGLVAIPGAKQTVFVLPSVTVVWASVTGHLRTMVFQGEAPNSWYGGLIGMNYLTVYYPADSTTWTPNTLMNFGRGNANCMPLPELVILGQPEMQQSVKSNENFEVKVIAHGTGLTYQWQMSGRDANWVDVPNSNSAVLTLCAADLGSYVALRCVITDENGNVVTSEQANVDIHPVVEFGSNLNELHLVNVESGRNVYLNFTPMVDGEYIFHFSHGAMDFYIQEILGGEYEQLNEDDYFLKLKLYAGNTYTVKVYSYVSTELKFWVTAPVTLELDEAFSGYFANNGDEQVFYFTAPETALYELYRSGDGIWFSVYNVQTGESCGNGTSFVTLEAGVTYRFDVTYTSWGFTSYSIQLRAIPKVTLGQSADVTVVPGLTGALAVYTDVDMFCVITASSANGMYPSSMQINAGDDGMFEDIYESSVVYLKAGKVYTLYIYNHMSAEPLDLTVSVNKAPDPDYIWFNGRSLNTVNETWVDWQIQPSNSGRNFTWTISDPSVLEITRVERYGFYVRGLKAGTATITVTADNGTTHTATFTVTEPASLNLGESHTVTIVPGQLNSFAFTPDHPGYYVIEVSGVDNAWLSNAYNCSTVNSTWYDETFYQYVHVYDSSLCVFEISTNHYKEMAGETRTMTVTVVPCQMPTVINIPASIVMFSEMSTTIRATFASVLEFDDLNWEIEGDCVTVQEGYYTHANIYANCAGTAVLVATTSDGAVVARCEITVTDSLPLTFGQSTQVDMAANGSARLCFTPDVSGYYVIDFESSNYHMTLHDQNGNYMEVSYSNGTITAWLEAGVTYTLYLHNKYGEDRVVNVSVSGLPALEMGKEILLGNYDKTVYYTFTPTETGIYSFDTIGCGAYFMCDGERHGVISGYGNDYGVKQAVYLKAGKQYVVRFDACWRENTSTFIERVGSIALGESQQVDMDNGAVYYAVVDLPSAGYYNVFASGSNYVANIFSVMSQDGMKDQTQWTYGFEMGYVTTACLEPGQYLIAMYVEKNGGTLTVKVDAAPGPDSINFYDTTITVGQSQHMELMVYPHHSARDFVWTVSDPSVVEIEYTYANHFYIRGLSAGTATITATASNGTTRTATITVKAPIDVQPGMSQEVTIQRDNSVTLQFETQMGGYYCLALPVGGDVWASVQSGGYHVENKWIDGMNYMYFYAYDYMTCSINVHYDDKMGSGLESITTTVLVDACKTPTSLNMPSELTMYVNSYATVNVTFSDPWEYGDLYWNFDCYEAEISSTYRNSVTLYAREPDTGLLSVWTTDGMAAAYCNVTIIDGIQLTFGQMTEFHMSDKGGIRVTFTPDVSGYYTLDFGGRRYSVDASSANDAMLMGYNGYSSYTIYLNAGVKYTFALWNYDGMDHTANVTIREPEILGLDDYRSQWMESYGWQAYQFVPETTGYYYLRVTDYQINGYIYSWDQMNPLTMYRLETGYDYVVAKLEAGQKYLVLAEKCDSWGNVNVEVSMHAAPTPENVSLSGSNTVAVGGYVDVSYHFFPVYAAEEFTITSSDESILRPVEVYYPNNYCTYEALRAGEVTLTIETASGLTGSITITVIQPITLMPGVESSVTLAPNGQAYFNFTVPESGLYVIEVNHDGWFEFISGENSQYTTKYDANNTGNYYHYYEFYEGVAYSFCYHGYSDMTLELLMQKAQAPTSASLPSQIVGCVGMSQAIYIDNGGYYWEDPRFSWHIEGDAANMNDWSYQFCGLYFAHAGEATLVATSYDGSVVLTCPITVVAAQSIEIGTPNHLSLGANSSFRYSIVPEKSGLYQILVDGTTPMLSRDVLVWDDMMGGYMTMPSWYNYYQLEAGREYILQINNNESTAVDFTVTVAEPDVVNLGETISITSGGTYLFRVEESGWYWLDTNSGYEINWYNVNAGGMGSVSYDNIGMDSITRSVVYMEAGVTYGCCIYGMDVTGQATFTKSGLPTDIYAHADATTIVTGMGTTVWVDFAEGRYSNVTVSMSQEGIVTLTSQNGRNYYFSALAEGTVTITFTTENGLTASVTLHVVTPIELALNERFQFEMAGESQTCFKVNDAYNYNVIYVYGEAVDLSVENGYHVTSISDGQGGTYYYYEMHGSSSTITLHKYESAGAVELEVRRAEMPTSITLPERITLEYGDCVTIQAIFSSYWEFRHVNWSWAEGCISVSTNVNQCEISTNHYGESTLTAYYYDDAGVYHGAECVIEVVAPSVAGSLTLNQFVRYDMQYAGDYPIYSFTATEDGSYFFACVADGDSRIYLYDSNWMQMGESNDYNSYHPGLWRDMYAGETVYLMARPYSGDSMFALNVVVATHENVYNGSQEPEDTTPYLSFRHLYRPYDAWVEDFNCSLTSEIWTNPLDPVYAIFYVNYVNTNGQWVSEPVHVFGTGEPNVESLNALGEAVAGENSSYYYRLQTYTWDTQTMVFCDWNGYQLSMPVNTQRPDFGFYTDSVPSNESFIKEFCWNPDSDEPQVFYYAINERIADIASIMSIEVKNGNANVEYFSDDVLKITVYTDGPDEFYLELEIGVNIEGEHHQIWEGIRCYAGESRKPQIVVGWIGNWGDEWFEMDEGYRQGLSMTAYDQMFVIFYLTYVNENGEWVYEPIHVTTSEHLRLSKLADWGSTRPLPGEENFDYFYCLTSDPAFWDQVGQIMYEYNGEILTMDIPIERNFFGFYANDNICNETYLPHYYEWDPDSNEHIFYFALRDEINNAKDYITSVEVTEGYADVELVNGSLVKITIFDDAPGDFWLYLDVYITNQWGDQYSMGHGIEVRRVQSKNPYLSYEWISFEDGYAFANGFGYETMLQTLPGRDHCLIFYMNYEDENGNWVSEPVDVTAGPYLTLERLVNMDEQIKPGAVYSNYYYRLRVEDGSWDQVTYISCEFDGGTFTLPVEIRRPQTGFYTEPEMNNDTFADWIQLYPELDELVIYLGRDQLDWIITDISKYNQHDGQMLPGCEYIKDIEVMENGMYKITFTDDLPEGGFHLELWVFAYNQEYDRMEDYTIGIWCEVITDTCKHSYDITYREPTCTQWGEQVAVCIHCGDTVVEHYEPLGHNVHEYHENFETVNGVTYCDRIVRCDRCGEETSRTHVPYAMLTFGSASGAVGSIIEVPVSISALTLASYQLTLRYGSGLKLLDIREGSKTLGGFTYNMDNGMILDYRVMNKTVEGELFILVFEVLESSDPNAYNISCDVEGFFQEDKTQLAIAVNDVFVQIHEHYDSAYDSDHICDGCGAVLSYCDDGDSDHYCDECGAQLTNHNYTSTDTAPTCTEDGYTTYTCSDCDHSYTVPIPATGHSYNGGTISVAPTCTAEGVMTYTCHCGHTKTEKINPTGHSYSSTVTAPTCMAQGYTTYTCDNCNNSYIGDVTDATGHTYDTGTISVAPTCITEGVMTYTCHCGHTKTEKIAATGHRYTSVVTAPTCTTQGYTTHTCACGVSYVDSYADAIGHNTTNTVYDIGKESTCLTAGVRGHYKCESCGGLFVMDNAVDPLRQVTEEMLIIPAHTLTDVAEVKATCTTNGVRAHKKCEGCIKYFIDGVEVTAADLIIVATGHSYIDVVTAPTCTEQGYTNHICQNCGDSYRDTFTAAIGHSYSSEVIDPTCTTNGYTIYTCQTCGHSVVSDYTPATGHTYNSGTVTVAPGCLTDGVMIYTCHCGHERIEKIAPTGHNYTSEVIAPGCTTVGYTRNVCQNCGHTYHSNYTAAIGHAAGEIREVNARFINGALYCDVLTFCRHCGEQIDETIRLKYRLGDVNDDGDVNVLDAMFVSQYVVGEIGTEKLNLEAADVNGDGEISVQDAMLIAQFIVGDIDHFEKEDQQSLGYGNWSVYDPAGDNLKETRISFGSNTGSGGVSVVEYAPVASLDPAYVEEAIRYGAKILTWEGVDYLQWGAYGDPCYYEIDGNIVTVHLGEPGDDWGEKVVLKRLGPDQLEVVSVTGFAGYYLTIGTVLTYIG